MAATTPLEIQDIRVATTVVGDNVVHGFLPDADAFVSLVNAGYGQADGVAVSNLSSSKIDHATAKKTPGAIGKGEEPGLQFTANITEGKSGVFQFSFLGNNATVAEFKLYKLHDTTTRSVHVRQARSRTAGFHFRSLVDRRYGRPHPFVNQSG